MPKKHTLEQFISLANIKHNYEYDYSKVVYKDANTKIDIICRIHGIFNQNPHNHKCGQGCPECGKTKKVNKIGANFEKYVEILKDVHENKYDYSKLVYNGYTNKSVIICPKHGEFEQSFSNHLHGFGCSKCKYELFSKNYSENPTGWTLTEWKKAGEISKRFDGFKVYIIKCFNEDEEFYKIGRTYLSVKYRFIGNLPYNYTVLNEIRGEAREIFKLESKLKRENKEFKYKPKIEFGGMYECFSHIKDINYDIRKTK